MEQNRFSHGGDVYGFERRYRRAPIDFSANINPLGMPEGALNTYREAADQLAQYPEPGCGSLIWELAEFEGISGSYFLCGNGASDLIYRLVQAKRPQRALLTAPAFSEYERALQVEEAEIDFHFLREEESFALTETILPAIAGHDLLILCNPNNPTGTVASQKLMMRILTECDKQGCLLCVDECFMDFTDRKGSLTDYFRTTAFRSPNLVILKAFTKTFAMPGLRLGYCITCNRELLHKMVLCSPCWSVSVPAIACGRAALQDKGYLRRTRSFIKGERQRLIDGIIGLGGVVYGSKANYVFFRYPDEELFQKLCEKGFLIRDCSNYRGLNPGYYRIAVRTEAENSALLAALEEISRQNSEEGNPFVPAEGENREG